MDTWLWIVALFGVYIAIAEAWVWWFARGTELPGKIDYILVLGSNGNKQSPVVMDRVASAYDAIQRFPMAKVILTGKPGEVVAYRELLGEKGLSQFLEDPDSTTTWDNVRLSEKLMKPGGNVLVVTSEYHQPRALAMAKSLGWSAWAYGQDGRIYEKRIYFFWKERFSNSKYLLPMVVMKFVR